MKKIITIAVLTSIAFAPAVFAARYRSAVSGRYVKASYAKSHTSTTYRSRR